jgi:hypothetical protein
VVVRAIARAHEWRRWLEDDEVHSYRNIATKAAVNPGYVQAVLPLAFPDGNNTALATNRRYAFHSVGALGAIEMTAPDRAEAVAKGLARLGLDKASRHYFDLHAVLDRKHSADWNREAISSLGLKPNKSVEVRIGC